MNTVIPNTFSTLTLLALVILFSSGCKSTKGPAEVKNTDISIFDNITKSTNIGSLVKEMTGTFTTANQAKEDTSYIDITLNMHPIWTTKTDKYLYVEQAATNEIDKPYRQRVYKLVKDGNGGFESHIYLLADEERFIGKGMTPAYFDQFDETILTEKEGCAVYMIQHADGSFSGSTRLDHCKSDFKGASYATSIVKIRPNNIMSWDQGFDATGAQVWGAEKGGYRFVRK